MDDAVGVDADMDDVRDGEGGVNVPAQDVARVYAEVEPPGAGQTFEDVDHIDDDDDEDIVLAQDDTENQPPETEGIDL